MIDKTTAANLTLTGAGRRWNVNMADCYDLSIPLRFDAQQPVFFGAPAASSSPLQSGTFLGDVRHGGSCNCATYSLTPHCNGTHTESVGHITRERISVRDVVREVLVPALLISVAPESTQNTSEGSVPAPQAGDSLITRQALQNAARTCAVAGFRALIVRTLPNSADKQQRNYDGSPPPAYFSSEAMNWIVAQNIDHLVVDLPSVDRSADAGHLTAHRLFWGMPPAQTNSAEAQRAHATITELAYIDDTIADGPYALNLQVAPFVADAAPSRPLLMRMTEA